MEDLFRMLPALLESFPDSPEVRQAVVFAVWRRAAGDGLSAHTVPIELSEKKLSIAVRDKIWKRHMESMAPQLLFRLNAILKTGNIGFLDFQIDEDSVNARLDSGSRAESEDTVDSGHFSLPSDLKEKAKRIKDPQLRKGFLESAAVYLKMKEVRKRY